MSGPTYPTRGAIPWDKALKAYIDYGDTVKSPEAPSEEGLEWYGSWDAETSYEKGDVVEYDGSSWVAVQDCPAGKEPEPEGDTMWALLASRGEVGPAGPEGPEGPEGPSGSAGGSSYIHDQIALASVWVVVHNLGRYPSVTVVDSGGSIIFPDIHYDNSNQVTIVFGSSTSGKVYLS